uniref:LisH domain-containing protein n=1 Tax=Steinernema glaseri TaxID=37863 RepID=A0A1I7Z4L0_9BILA
MDACATLRNPTAKWVLAYGPRDHFTGIYPEKPASATPSPKTECLSGSPSPGSRSSSGPSDDDTHSRGSPSSLKENVADMKMDTDDQLAGPSESPVPVTKPLKVDVDDVSDRVIAAKIHQNAKFHSFAEFHQALEAWKRVGFHSFRIASSEKMKSADKALMDRIYYRYVVYHCAHYGPPRMREHSSSYPTVSTLSLRPCLYPAV